MLLRLGYISRWALASVMVVAPQAATQPPTLLALAPRNPEAGESQERKARHLISRRSSRRSRKSEVGARFVVPAPAHMCRLPRASGEEGRALRAHRSQRLPARVVKGTVTRRSHCEHTCASPKAKGAPPQASEAAPGLEGSAPEDGGATLRLGPCSEARVRGDGGRSVALGAGGMVLAPQAVACGVSWGLGPWRDRTTPRDGAVSSSCIGVAIEELLAQAPIENIRCCSPN